MSDRYIRGPATTLRYVKNKQTARKVVFHQVYPQHDDLTRDAEFPFPYLDKTFWRERLGSPEVIEVTVRSLKLREGNDEPA